MLALCALKNLFVTFLDIKSAFLYGKLHEEIYMRQPDGFTIKGEGQLVYKLHHALYGLKQAALAW